MAKTSAASHRPVKFTWTEKPRANCQSAYCGSPSWSSQGAGEAAEQPLVQETTVLPHEVETALSGITHNFLLSTPTSFGGPGRLSLAMGFQDGLYSGHMLIAYMILKPYNYSHYMPLMARKMHEWEIHYLERHDNVGALAQLKPLPTIYGWADVHRFFESDVSKFYFPKPTIDTPKPGPPRRKSTKPSTIRGWRPEGK